MDHNEELAAANAELLAGYDNQPTETPAAEVTKQEPEVTAAPKEEPAQAEPQPEDKPDPLKDVLARLEKYEKSHDTLSGKLGRLMQSHEQIQQSLATAQAAAKQVGDAPSKQEITSAAKDPEKWAALKKDYPDWATATEELLDARIPKFDAEAFEQKIAKEIEGKTAEMQGRIIESSLNAVLPKWRDKVNTDDFKGWIATQPEEVKALANSDDVGDAAQMLTLYREHLAKPAPTQAPTPAPTSDPKKPDTTARAARLAAAVTPRGTGGHAPGKSEVDEFVAGYNSN
jgi:hypothetical protein